MSILIFNSRSQKEIKGLLYFNISRSKKQMLWSNSEIPFDCIHYSSDFFERNTEKFLFKIREKNFVIWYEEFLKIFFQL